MKHDVALNGMKGGINEKRHHRVHEARRWTIERGHCCCGNVPPRLTKWVGRLSGVEEGARENVPLLAQNKRVCNGVSSWHPFNKVSLTLKSCVSWERYVDWQVGHDVTLKDEGGIGCTVCYVDACTPYQAGEAWQCKRKASYKMSGR